MKMQAHMLLFLLASIGLIVLPHVYHVPIAILAFFYVLLAWRFIGVWRPKYLPSKWLLLLLSVLGMALLYSQHQGLFGRDAGTRLFLIALGLKLLEIRSQRDLYLVNFLAFIVAASQFLYAQNLLMAAYILLVCCVLLATLVLINSRDIKPFAALQTAAVIIAQALPMAVVLFVLFPRLEAPRWMLFDNKPQARTGLSDSMEPGSITELGLSDELAFRVKFDGAMPPPAQRYWRGPVLPYTDGKRWTRSASADFSQHMASPTFNGRLYHYTLLLEPRDKNWVFALDMPAEFSHPLRRNAYYQLITSDNPDKRAEYKVGSYPGYNTGVITGAELADALQLPGEPSAKIQQLVRQLRGDTAERYIGNLLQHFRTENFYYTLTPPAMEQNPIEAFLFKTRHGFCEHYATAFVYLMRAAKIPARVVTGYQGGELNELGGFLEIRQADAHAWAEVWLERQGWVRVDPTAAVAPERIEKSLNPNLLRAGDLVQFAPSDDNMLSAYHWLKQTRQLWSHADYNWQRWVINYNSNRQTSFLSSLGVDTLRTALYWLMACGALITALLSWLLLTRRRPKTDKALRIYQRFCRKLARHGLVRQHSEGERDFAGRAQAALPECADIIDRITDLFSRWRYGRTPMPDDIAELERAVTQLERMLPATRKATARQHSADTPK